MTIASPGKRSFIIRTILLLLSSAVYFQICPGVEAPPDAISEESLQYEREFGEYMVRNYHDQKQGNSSVLQIFRNGSLVFSDKNYRFTVEEYADTGSSVKNGTDITGDGEPDLVVNVWTGGAHGAYSYYVFSIGKEFRKIDAGNGDVGWAHFEDLDGDGVLEFIAIDKNFEYWNVGYADSPFTEVIMEYKDGKYVFSPRFMRKPPLVEEEFEQIVEEAKQAIADNVSSDHCGGDFILPWEGPWYMQKLIYSGNPDDAWKYFDHIWPEGVPGKEKYLHDFKEQLKQSGYWEEIAAVYKISL
jgi:hypothetical protein